MKTEEELKKEIAIFPSKTLHQYDSGKLLWKGTIKEAIEKGKVTQEEVDKWNMEDEIGEDYMEGFLAGQLAEREKCLKMIEPREFNENITKIMNKNGFVTYDDNECIWVCCNIIKNYLKEELTKKVSEEGK